MRHIPRFEGGKQITCRKGDAITDAHANQGYAVILNQSVATGKLDDIVVNLSGTTAGVTIFGELLDVNGDYCTVEVKDMVFRAAAAYAAGDNDDVILSSSTTGVGAHAPASATVNNAPTVYAGFTESGTHYLRAMRIGA